MKIHSKGSFWEAIFPRVRKEQHPTQCKQLKMKKTINQFAEKQRRKNEAVGKVFFPVQGESVRRSQCIERKRLVKVGGKQKGKRKGKESSEKIVNNGT